MEKYLNEYRLLKGIVKVNRRKKNGKYKKSRKNRGDKKYKGGEIWPDFGLFSNND